MRPHSALHSPPPPRNFEEFRVENAGTLPALPVFRFTPHMAGELLNTLLGVRVTHVPYKGDNGVAGCRRRQIPDTFSNFPVVFLMFRQRSCGAAITSLSGARRLDQFPTSRNRAYPGLNRHRQRPRPSSEALRHVIARVSTRHPRSSPPGVQEAQVPPGQYQSDADTLKHAAFSVGERQWSKVIREGGCAPSNGVSRRGEARRVIDERGGRSAFFR